MLEEKFEEENRLAAPPRRRLPRSERRVATVKENLSTYTGSGVPRAFGEPDDQ